MVQTEDEAEDGAPGAWPSGSTSADAGCEHPAAGLSERPPPAATTEEMPAVLEHKSQQVQGRVRARARGGERPAKGGEAGIRTSVAGGRGHKCSWRVRARGRGAGGRTPMGGC